MANNGNHETVEEVIEEYINEDGVKVTKKTIKKTITSHKTTTNTITVDAPKKSSFKFPSFTRSKETPTATASTPSTLDDKKDAAGFTKFEKFCLEEHNKYRKKHGVPAIKLSRQLCDYAQEWADNLAKTGSFNHRSNNKYGENLYMQGGTGQLTGEGSVKSWYDEIKDYHYYGQEPPMSALSKTGHFTQVVWKNCTAMGIARKAVGSSLYVVANYEPQGNFIRHFAENVLAPK